MAALSRQYRLVPQILPCYAGKNQRSEKTSCAFWFGIAANYELLFSEQLDLDRGAATRSSLVNGFCPLTDQSFKPSLRASLRWGMPQRMLFRRQEDAAEYSLHLHKGT
jgi:hypothetical protein